MSKELIGKLNRAADEINRFRKAASNYVVVDKKVAEQLNNLLKQIRKEKIKEIYE